jgi:hypothetical protein
MQAHCYPEGYSIGLYQPIISRLDSDFKDKRRRMAFDWLSEKMGRLQNCRVNKLSENESERKRAQRLVNNAKVPISSFLGACCLSEGSLEGRQVIHVCDQTEILFPSALGRLTDSLADLGVVGTGTQYGKNAVVGLVLDAWSRVPLGLGSLSFHSRPPELTSHRSKEKIKGAGRDERPLRYRESSKWRLTVEHCAQRLHNSEHIIHIIDREADNLNFYLEISRRDGVFNQVSARNELLVRLKNDRWVNEDCHAARRLSTAMRDRSVVATQVVEITEDKRLNVWFTRDKDYQYHRRAEWSQKRVGRIAVLEVRYLCCKMDKANNTNTKSDMPKAMLKQLLAQSDWFDKRLSFIEVREVESRDPKTGQCLQIDESDKVDWMLMTTMPISGPQAAMKVVSLYGGRFRAIEQLFRILKTDGFDIEAAQQKSIHSLLKITAMALKAGLTALKLVEARNQTQGYPIAETFSEREIQVLALLSAQYEGSTEVQRNPHDPAQLAWAAWIIGRMGGWKPQNKQRPPGPITMKRGLDMFFTIFKGVALVNGWQWEIDVSQP